MHDNFDSRLEQMNKFSLLLNKKIIEGLVDILQSHVVCVDRVTLCVCIYVCICVCMCAHVLVSMAKWSGISLLTKSLWV